MLELLVLGSVSSFLQKEAIAFTKSFPGVKRFLPRPSPDPRSIQYGNLMFYCYDYFGHLRSIAVSASAICWNSCSVPCF